jgi:hypothetical protein
MEGIQDFRHLDAVMSDISWNLERLCVCSEDGFWIPCKLVFAALGASSKTCKNTESTLRPTWLELKKLQALVVLA